MGNSEGGAHSIVGLLRKPVENIQEQALKILVNLLSYRGTFACLFIILGILFISFAESKEVAVAALLEDKFKALNDLLFSKKVNIQNETLTLVTALFDTHGKYRMLFILSVLFIYVFLFRNVQTSLQRKWRSVYSFVNCFIKLQS